MSDDHKTLSPSKAGRWFKCPGSIRKVAAIAGANDRRSAAADDGTHTHYLLNRWLTEPAFAPVVGQTYTSDVGTFCLDEDRMERLIFAREYIEGQYRQHGGTYLSEVKLTSDKVFGRDDIGGTADVVFFGSTVTEVVDLKDGMNAVQAKNNFQLLIYAILAAAQGNAETIRMTIIQPKLRVFGASGIDAWEISRKELLEWIPKIVEAARLTDQPDAPVVPGEEQCRWCPAKGSCLELIEHSLSAAGIGFGAVDLPGEVVSINATELTNERLRSLILAIPLIETMIEAAQEEALARLQAGTPIDGLKVIRGRGSRSWNVEDDVVADRLKRMGVPKDVVYKTSVLTPTQAKAVKWNKKTGEEKKLTPRQIKTLDEMISQKEGKLKVVSEHVVGKSIEFAPLAFSPVIPEWMR